MDEHGEINILIFNGLTGHDGDNQVVPGLAKSWEFDEDTCTYTFHLEEGVKWHDGEDFTAEDVKFTVKDTGEIQKVVMKDEAKPEETPTETPTETPETTPTSETKTTEETKKSTAPKTGDNTPILFWILLAGAGMAGLGGTVILRKKKK